MPKILLVEDDNNLREIFQMRLQADGYTAIVAADGEEGLVTAMREKPDLVIADVMMPKLSGFEMAESLRASPDTKDIKIIMMTALGQAEDQARGEKLGVIKYLVKSQVTLEDFARVIKDTLGPGDPDAAEKSAQNEASNINNQQESETHMQPQDQTNQTPAADDSANSPSPSDNNANLNSGGEPTANPVSGGQQSIDQEQNVVQKQIDDFGSGAGSPADESATPGVPTADPAPTSTDAPDVPPSSEPAQPPEHQPPQFEQPEQPGAPPIDPTSNSL